MARSSPTCPSIRDGNRSPNFLDFGSLGAGERASLAIVHGAASPEIYRNYLDWLCASFDVDETTIRSALASRLKVAEGARVLVTGCGLGDDLPTIRSYIGKTGQLYAQDISATMVASRKIASSAPPPRLFYASFLLRRRRHHAAFRRRLLRRRIPFWWH